MTSHSSHRAPSISNSLASSQQHMLADRSNGLEPPAAPFASIRGERPISGVPSLSPSTASLSVNYLPTKFSGPPSPGLYKRKGKSVKQGGGREAFKSGEARMPGANDEDYDGVDNLFGKDGKKPKMHWNRFKWILFIVNLIISVISLSTMIILLLTWLNVFHHADIVRVGNHSELVVSTLAATVGIITSLFGWAGILLNNRGFLAVYTVLLWIMFIFICAPGYMTYKKRTFNLEGKINSQWSRDIGMTGRLRIQDQLQCCGYFNPFVEATVSQTCYSRSVLPGCKNAYIKFERSTLERWYTVAFSLVPVQLLAILSALLCSNHVTYRWGKGMMPKAYRLNVNAMALIMDSYANQLAERYGDGSVSGTSTPVHQGYAAPTLSGHGHAQYTSLGGANDESKKM